MAISLAEGGLVDLPHVMAVMDDSFDARFGESWTAAQCAALLPMPGVWLSLARDEGDVVGFALSRIVVDEAELLLLAVRSGAQRRGTGKMLLDRFVRRARTAAPNACISRSATATRLWRCMKRPASLWWAGAAIIIAVRRATATTH